MVLCDLEVIERTLRFLNISSGALSQSDGKITFRPQNSKQPVCGFATILDHAAQQSTSPLCSLTREESAELWQWLEYCICVTNHADTQTTALTDLNNVLSKRSYFIGYKPTIADVIFYYTLYPLMVKMSLQDKEAVRNISRWFSLVQHIPNIQRSHNLQTLTFSKNPLYS